MRSPPTHVYVRSTHIHGKTTHIYVKILEAGSQIRAAIVASKLTSALPLVSERILPRKNSAYLQPRDQTSAAKLYRRISFCSRVVLVLDSAVSVARFASGDSSTAMALPIADASGTPATGRPLLNQAGRTNSNTSGARYKQVQKLRVSVGRMLCKREQPKSEILATNLPP